MKFLTSSDPRISIGRFTYGEPKFKIWFNTERIKIGSFCSIADEVVIFGGGEHQTRWVTTFPLRAAFNEPNDGAAFSKGETIIGNDVWIASRVMILSGVTIGNGAVIGAGSVVASNVPPYAIVVGNPAKIIRYRFTESEIEKLLALCWWDWDINKIKSNISLLCSPNIEDVLNCK